MGTYRNYKCGNCNKSLSGGYQPSGAVENFSRLGPETFLCPYCKTPNKTNRIPFYQMGLLEKAWTITLIITSVLLFSFIISLILSAIATTYIDGIKLSELGFGFSNRTFLIIFVSLLILSMTILIRKQLKTLIKSGHFFDM